MQNCVFFEILYLFMSLWEFALVETQGLGRSPSLEGLFLYISKFNHSPLRRYIEKLGYLVYLFFMFIIALPLDFFLSVSQNLTFLLSTAGNPPKPLNVVIV